MIETITKIFISSKFYEKACGYIWKKYWNFRWEGLQELEKNPGSILAFNHSSFLDVTLIDSFRRQGYPTYYLANTGSMKSAVIRGFYSVYEGITVDKTKPSSIRSALNTMKTRLKNGENIGIYPEGKRSKDGLLQRPKTGIAKLAIESGSKIIPIGLIGFDRAWPTTQTLPPKSCEVYIRIGKALDFRDPIFKKKNNALKLITDIVMFEIAELIDQPYKCYLTSEEEILEYKVYARLPV